METKMTPYKVGDKLPDVFMANVMEHIKEKLSDGKIMDRLVTYTTIGYDDGKGYSICDLSDCTFVHYDEFPTIENHDEARYCITITDYCELPYYTSKTHDAITLGEVKLLDKYFGAEWSKGL